MGVYHMQLIRYLSFVMAFFASYNLIGMDLKKTDDLKTKYDEVQRRIREFRKGYPKNTRWIKVEKCPIEKYDKVKIDKHEVFISEVGKPFDLWPVKYFHWEPLSNLIQKWKNYFPERKFSSNNYFVLYYTQWHKYPNGSWKQGSWTPLRKTGTCSTLEKYKDEYKKAGQEFYLDINVYSNTSNRKKI
jgi:hypothetical protein